MVNDRDDRNAERGRRGGYAAAFGETALPMERADAGAAAITGVWNGAVAGVVMGLVMMIFYAAAGLNFWTPMRIISVSIIGPAALTGGVVPVIVGMIVHLVTSAILGMVFAGLAAGVLGRITTGVAVVAGILYGLIIWIAAQFIIQPITFPIMAAAFVPWIYGVSHAVFGAVLGLLPNSALKM